MTRRILTLFGALLALPVPAWAGLVERDGYSYVEIGLGGLWGGFFVFLFGILFVLVGLLLWFLWRRSARDRNSDPMAQAAMREDDDNERVF